LSRQIAHPIPLRGLQRGEGRAFGVGAATKRSMLWIGGFQQSRA
jgi:hypothetical protein